jgi:hypothetical protein
VDDQSFANTVPVIFPPDIFIDQYLTTPADIATRTFWQDFICSLLIRDEVWLLVDSRGFCRQEPCKESRYEKMKKLQ